MGLGKMKIFKSPLNSAGVTEYFEISSSTSNYDTLVILRFTPIKTDKQVMVK